MNPENTTIKQVKWYHKPVMVVMAILFGGALALPLLWTSPAFGKKLKIIITLFVLVLSVWLVKASMDLYVMCLNQLRELQGVLSL